MAWLLSLQVLTDVYARMKLDTTTLTVGMLYNTSLLPPSLSPFLPLLHVGLLLLLPLMQPSSAASKPALDKLVSDLLTDSDLLEVALNSGQEEAASLLTF